MAKLDRHTIFFLCTVILIPLLMITMWLFIAGAIRNTETEVNAAMDEVLAGARVGEKAEVEQGLQTLEHAWKKQSDLLVMFLNHDDVTQVELGIVQFAEAVRQEDYEVAALSREEVKCLLEMMRSSDEINLRNIL